MPLTKGEGIVGIPSNHSVDQTVEKLKGILHAKGVTLFALIDHSGEAGKVGMKMRPTKLLIFGSPKAGTPIMLAIPVSRSISRSKFWSGKMKQEKCGLPTTARNTCRNGTAYRAS